MLQIQKLTKSFGDRLLLDSVSFVLSPGERVGLVGRNGHGKSTLLKILTGEEPADAGEIRIPRNYRLGFLTQHLDFNAATVLEEAVGSLPETEDGRDESYRAKSTLLGLGFGEEQFSLPPSALSGGFQVRLDLVKVLLAEPDLLLLDEPTNYLDIVSLRWLARFLRGWPKDLILVTHDRGFMDQVITHTLAIHRKKLRKVEGTTRKLYEQIEQEEELHERTRVNQEKNLRRQERFIERFRAKASKARSVQSRVKQLEKRGRLERLEAVEELDFRFTPAPFPAKQVGWAEQLRFTYPGIDPPLIPDLSFTVGSHDRIAIVGRNGKGKTTLLRLLTGELQPESGEVRFHDRACPAHFAQGHVDRLDPARTVVEEILSVRHELGMERARGICGAVMFSGDDAEKKVGVLSGGEKSRVLLGRILAQPANLLLLDEPSHHLDMQSIDALCDAIDVFPGAVILVSHSELILERMAQRLVVFDGGHVRVFEGGYRDFMDQVGWAEEEEEGRGKPRGPTASKKELRKMRAAILAERAKLSRPLEQKIQDTEEKIIAAEARAEEVEKALVEASTSGSADAIAEHSRSLKLCRGGIEELYQRLESLAEALDRVSADFDSRLAELE